MTRIRVLVLAALVCSMVAAPPAHAEQFVTVESNRYLPRDLYISPGDTVVWSATDAGHTVTADDGRFNFYPHRTMSDGESVSWTFPIEETVPYYCRVHGEAGGAGMAGRVIVGAGSPSQTPTPTVTPTAVEERLVPSEAYPTITKALRDIPAGGIVSIAPGTYREGVIANVPGVTIRGTGLLPTDVVLDGGGELGSAITAVADGIRVQNLTAVDYANAGLTWESVKGFDAGNVRVESSGAGISVSGSMRGRIHDSVVVGSGGAGVLVNQCTDCDTIVENMVAQGNLAGIVAQNAGGVVIRRSESSGNRSGIVLRTSLARTAAPQQGVHVWRNDIHDNGVLAAGTQPAAPSLERVIPAGIWVAGGFHNRIEQNEIDDPRYGVLVTSLVSASFGNEILSNSITAPVDLAWDGVGASTCFAGNTAPDAALVFEPAPLEDLYACAMPVVVGIPYAPLIFEVARTVTGV